MPSRSDLYERQPDAFPPHTSIGSTSPSSSSPSSTPSLPTTPSRSSHTPLPSQSRITPSSVGLLTPSSSKASLSPALSRYKDQCQPSSPAFSRDHHLKPKRPSIPSRRLFFPVRASLELYTHPARSSVGPMSDHSSRPGSPVPRSRAMSPQRPELIARPSSRCESLLRDTLRRDEHERSLSYRTASRSPNRWAGRRSRPRGNSFLEALRRDDSPDSGCEFEDNVFIRPKAERENSSRHSRAQAMAMAMRGRGAISASSTEAGSLPYGSPSSPSPMPPSMPRTHTSPAVPRTKGLSCDDERRGAFTRTPSSPYSGRRSLPNTVTQSQVSNDSSPKQHYNTLSPHESVLRAKLNYVLQQAGPVSADESAALSQRTGHPRRNHQRAFSHGVTVVTSPKHIPSSTSPSPQSLAPSSLSNSATDLVRVECTRPHRQGSLAERASPSSPSEPLTPPPTPPFNARTAAEACKRMNGYVSFANVEGLGEPPGLDIDQDNNEDGLGTLKRWLRLLPLAFGNGSQGPPERAAGRLSVSRQRSNSTSSG